jgi:hypothetical protein
MTNHTPAEQFLDLEIRIFQRDNQGYPVEITLGDSQRFRRGYLSADIVPWSTSGNPARDGEGLFKNLFADRALSRAWDQALGRSLHRRIRLWIDEQAPELHPLPWEMLRDDQVGSDMLSAQTHTPFSRYLRIELPWDGPVKERPIRALVVISDPADLKTRYDLTLVDVDKEREALEAAFVAVGQDQLQADFLPTPVTMEELGEKLLQADYHVLHFVGHGAFSTRRAQAALYLQDQQGYAQRVLDDELAGLVKRQGKQLRLISLVACQSAVRSKNDAFLGLGPKLVTAGAPAVVAMQDVVTIETARKFSATFYKRLVEHGQVDLATNEARSALLTVRRADAAVPVLFMRCEQGVLFQRLAGASARPQVSTEQPGLEKVLAVYVQDNGELYQTYQNKLVRKIAKHFNREELEVFCYTLDFEYQGRSNTLEARKLTEYFHNRGLGHELVTAIYHHRQDISWLEKDDVDPLKLHQAMLETYNFSSLTRLCSQLARKYGGSYNQAIFEALAQVDTLSDKIHALIEWHRTYKYIGFWNQFIEQVIQDHPRLSEQITFGGVPYRPSY